MVKQLLLNDLIIAVENRQKLKSSLSSFGDFKIKIDSDKIETSSNMRLSDAIKRYDAVIDFICGQINKDRTDDMRIFWAEQALEEKESISGQADKFIEVVERFSIDQINPSGLKEKF